jgi:hypothetical protein
VCKLVVRANKTKSWPVECLHRIVFSCESLLLAERTAIKEGTV